MNPQVDGTKLEDVLETYYFEVEEPNVDAMQHWIARFPAFEREIVEFTVAWIEMSYRTENELSTHQDELDVRNIVRGMLNEEAETTFAIKSTDSMPNLIDEIGRIGLTIEEFSKNLRLTPQFIRKLDLRRFRYDRLPLELIERISELLSKSIFVVAQYLNLPAARASMARFRSDQRLETPAQDDFFEAVRLDPTLIDEHKAFWLALEHVEQK